MTYHVKLIEEGSWSILLQNLSTVSTFISKRDNRSDRRSNEFSWWLIKPNSLKKNLCPFL